MSKRMLNMSVAAVLAAGVVAASNAASAAPFADALAIRKAAGTDVEKVWGRRFGWGFGAGFLGGAILGGALAAPYYSGGPYYYGDYYYGAPSYPPAAYGPGYYPAPGAYGPGYYQEPGYEGDGDASSYCASRYRSYDPATGTFLGYDGMRHPCP